MKSDRPAADIVICGAGIAAGFDLARYEYPTYQALLPNWDPAAGQL